MPVIQSPMRSYPKASLVTAGILCFAMLVISGYGLGQWFSNAQATPAPAEGIMYDAALVYHIALMVAPLTLMALVWIMGAQRLERGQLSGSYHLRIDQLQKRLNAQEDLLQMITDHENESIIIFDKSNRFWFLNSGAAHILKASVGDIIGHPIAKALGIDRARKLEARLDKVRNSGQPIESLDQRMETDGQMRFIQERFELVKPIGEFSGGVIMRAEDVTNLLVERERRESMLRQVIATLVAVVDRRDPFAAGHSARVGQLARAIAEEMVLGEKDIDAAEIAGSLMNFGKVLVPRHILTKSGALTAEELQHVRESILTSADILSIIDFVSPVAPTLRHVLERYDGTGAPKGLKGNDILITARIVTVANAYVALASARAHRPGLPVAEALSQLKKDAGKLYDPQVVAALGQCVQKRPPALDWLSQKAANG